MKAGQSEILGAVSEGLERTREFWKSGAIIGLDRTRALWAPAKIFTRDDRTIRVQLGDGSRYTITIEEDEL